MIAAEIAERTAVRPQGVCGSLEEGGNQGQRNSTRVGTMASDAQVLPLPSSDEARFPPNTPSTTLKLIQGL